MRPIKPLLTGIALALLVLPASLQADVPKLIGYQGKLTNGSGQAVVTGHYNFKFRLYNDPVAAGSLWEETQSNIEVANGLYSVLLGTATSLGTLPFDTQYWLEIEVNNTPLSPRQPLSAAPYAIAAATASWVNNPYWLQLTTGGVCTSHTHPGGGSVARADNLSNGAKNDIPYQTGANSTSFISNNNAYNGFLLQSNGGNGGTAPSWVNPLNIVVGTASEATTLSASASGSYQNILVGTATIAKALTNGSYENIRVGTATIAKALTNGSYENIRAGTATIAMTLSTNANGTYPNMTVGTASSANALAAGPYENIRAGTATIAMTLATSASGTYPSMTAGNATNAANATLANSLAAGASGTYENIRAGTATIAMTLATSASGTYPSMTVGNATNASNATSANSLAAGASGTYENIRAGTATIAMTLATSASGTYPSMTAGNATNAANATSASSLSAGASGTYENIRAGTATIAMTLATSAGGTYPGMTVGNATNATSANSLGAGASGTYENIRAGTATIAMTLATSANGTYPNMTVGTASSANALATGSYENIRAGTATVALGISTTTISIGSYVNLPNLDTVSDSTTACQGLGFAEIDFTGVKQVIFSVYGYKGYDGGNNDLIWELYQEDGTPGTLIQVKDTNNSAGTRYVQAVMTSGIPAGGARVRIRAWYDKSIGDAAFLGASLKLIR